MALNNAFRRTEEQSHNVPGYHLAFLQPLKAHQQIKHVKMLTKLMKINEHVLDKIVITRFLCLMMSLSLGLKKKPENPGSHNQDRVNSTEMGCPAAGLVLTSVSKCYTFPPHKYKKEGGSGSSRQPVLC